MLTFLPRFSCSQEKMSADLQWLLVRNSSCFLIRRKVPRTRGITFTNEPNNLINRNAFKYNGLVNPKTIGVSPTTDSQGVVLSTKRSKGGRAPVSMHVKFPLSKDRRRSYRFIRKHLGSTDYRQDLREVAVRRASALVASQRPHKKLKLKKRRR